MQAFKEATDLHSFDDRMPHLVAVVADAIHRHVHGQLTCHWLPKGIPARHQDDGA